MSVILSPHSRRSFADFSKEIAGRFIEIRGANELLSTLRLQTSIEGGALQIPVRNRDAAEVARELSEKGAKLQITVVEDKR